MKSSASLCLILPFIFYPSLPIENKINNYKSNTETKVSISIPCQPTTLIAAAPIKKRTDLFAALPRKSVYSLTAAEITSIKNGIRAMKNTLPNDPTSWTYQAAIHGSSVTPAQIAWNSCQHNPTFFLSWHRMYLHFFERILRSKSGNPNLTLPYWDYQTNGVLHPEYRLNSMSNPLYDCTRNPSINAGGTLPGAIMIAFDNALNNNTDFYNFSGAINNPHGSVHISIGGNMAGFATAGLDPSFWLHHANVDRLWEKWLKKCGGRANPTDNNWLNTTFTFFDENGTQVQMKGSEIVNTSAQLNYYYAPTTLTLPCSLQDILTRFQKFKLLKSPPIRIRNRINKASFKQSVADSFNLFKSNFPLNQVKLSGTDTTDRILIELEGIQINTLPEGIVEVYINQPATQAPNPRSNNFIGVLDLFSIASTHKHDMQQTVTLDASKAFMRLGLKLSEINNMEISFVVRGNTVQGREKPTTADVQIGAVFISIEKFQQ